MTRDAEARACSSDAIPLRVHPPDDEDLQQRAAHLAARYGLARDAAVPARAPELVLETAGLSLMEAGARRGRPVRVDLARKAVRRGAGASRRQPLARAFGLQHGRRALRILDATPGFGEDAWVLAALGCELTLVERCPAAAALLEEGLARAAGAAPDIAARLTLRFGDARQVLAQEQLPFDGVLIDPMFPPRRQSAQEGKAMRLLRAVAGADEDAAALLEAARASGARRIAAKRPRRAAPLGPEPTVRHEGKAARFDVYVPSG